eukprot:jgi/Botrbrau1/1956/Bobra.0052s0001.1
MHSSQSSLKTIGTTGRVSWQSSSHRCLWWHSKISRLFALLVASLVLLPRITATTLASFDVHRIQGDLNIFDSSKGPSGIPSTQQNPAEEVVLSNIPTGRLQQFQISAAHIWQGLDPMQSTKAPDSTTNVDFGIALPDPFELQKATLRAPTSKGIPIAAVPPERPMLENQALSPVRHMPTELQRGTAESAVIQSPPPSSADAMPPSSQAQRRLGMAPPPKRKASPPPHKGWPPPRKAPPFPKTTPPPPRRAPPSPQKAPPTPYGSPPTLRKSPPPPKKASPPPHMGPPPPKRPPPPRKTAPPPKRPPPPPPRSPPTQRKWPPPPKSAPPPRRRPPPPRKPPPPHKNPPPPRKAPSPPTRFPPPPHKAPPPPHKNPPPPQKAPPKPGPAPPPRTRVPPPLLMFRPPPQILPPPPRATLPPPPILQPPRCTLNFSTLIKPGQGCAAPAITVVDTLAATGSSTPTCLWIPGTVNDLTSGKVAPLLCNEFIFQIEGKPVLCNSFTGDLSLVFVNIAGPMGAMRMGSNLATLGLNIVELIDGSVIVVNLGTPGAVVPTAFLPNLKAVRGTVYLTDANVGTSRAPLFTSLPLSSLKFAFAVGALSTGVTDMTSFSGLQCIVSNLFLAKNPALTSLSGLEAVEVINFLSPNTSSIDAAGNPLLNFPAAFRPLVRVAGCPGTGLLPATNVKVNITVASCPTPITTFVQLCSYISGARACP